MNIDKHYEKHKKYMQDRHWPYAPKVEFEIWEQLKKAVKVLV